MDLVGFVKGLVNVFGLLGFYKVWNSLQGLIGISKGLVRFG